MALTLDQLSQGLKMVRPRSAKSLTLRADRTLPQPDLIIAATALEHDLIVLTRVIYDRQRLEEAVKKIVSATRDFYFSGLKGERIESPEEWARLFYLAWDEWIYKLAPLAKGQQWETEGELRIVHELKVADFPDIRFSQKKSSLARYLPLDFPCWVKERVSRLPIAKVMVGPRENQASTRVSAILLLEQMGYPNVQVETSRCTLVER